MQKADVVIIGGSAAGLTAAISSRRRNPDKTVTLIRKEKRVLVPCGIPYIFGILGSPSNNLIPDAQLEKLGVNIVIDTAVQIDKVNKVVKISNDEAIGYDKLIIATGSIPSTLPIPGIDKTNVFAIKKDVEYLQQMLDAVNQSKHIVIIGGGFIGAEFADECKKNRENTVTIIEKLPHCLQLAFDDEFCTEIESTLTAAGVGIVTNQIVTRILGDEKIEAVELGNGQTLKADVLIVSIGVLPNTELAKKASMRIDSSGGISVDRFQNVIDEQDIFACGDCSIKFSYFSGKPAKAWLASVATQEARLVAANLFAPKFPSRGVIGVFSTQIGTMAVAAAGLTERQANIEGLDVVVGRAQASSKHPGNMPGASSTSVKLIFSRDKSLLLGGETAGDISVGEMINTVSACLQNGMTAQEISLFQMGTHPMLCASPIAYQIVNAAEQALAKLK